MMRMMKAGRQLGLGLWVLLAAIGMLIPGGSLGADKIKIGVLLTSDTPIYVQTKDAAIRELAAAAFGQDRVVFDVKEAKVDSALAAKIAKQFEADRVRLVIAMGTTGHPASTASRKAPSLNPWSRPSRDRVPSGKIRTGVPFARWRRQWAIMCLIDSRSPRSTRKSSPSGAGVRWSVRDQKLVMSSMSAQLITVLPSRIAMPGPFRTRRPPGVSAA